MSDAVLCRLVLTGAADALSNCRRTHFESGEFDFNSVVPMPPELDIEDDSAVTTGYAALFGDWREPASYWTWKEAASQLGLPFPLESREQLLACIRSLDCADMYLSPAQQYKDNVEKFGHGSWYGWCKEHWGTKWNAEATKIEAGPNSITVRFICASSFAKPVVAALSKKWPELQVHVMYADESQRWGRDYVLKGGREVEKAKRSPGDILKELGE
jgi:hypothetical protein